MQQGIRRPRLKIEAIKQILTDGGLKMFFVKCRPQATDYPYYEANPDVLPR
jgi:hypothetical protein